MMIGNLRIVKRLSIFFNEKGKDDMEGICENNKLNSINLN